MLSLFSILSSLFSLHSSLSSQLLSSELSSAAYCLLLPSNWRSETKGSNLSARLRKWFILSINEFQTLTLQNIFLAVKYCSNLPWALISWKSAMSDVNEDTAVADFLEILEEHRKNCERQGKYVEAEIAKNRLDELKLHEENRRRVRTCWVRVGRYAV